MADKLPKYLVDIEAIEAKKEDIPEYQPSPRDVTVIDYVGKRFKAMQESRSVIDKDWDTYQTMIDAIFEPYPDNRSSSVVPLASSIIELYVAEANKIKTDFRFKSDKNEFADNARALEHVWKRDWRKSKRQKTMSEAEYIVAGFGTSVIYTGYEAYEKTQYDMEIGEEDGEVKWVEKKIPIRNIIIDNVDIRNFWIDNEAIDDISQASDCYYRQWMSYQKYETVKNSPIYENTEYVKPVGYSTAYNTFTTKEQNTKQGDYVLFEHYWNIEKDVYVILANGVKIRETPVPNTIDGIKALPFVIRVLGKKNYSIYGRGLCETLMMFNAEINDLRELLMDAIRRSNTQTLAIGNGLTFNGRSFSYDNEILTFDGDFGGNFQQVSGTPPNQAIFSYMQEIYKSIAIYCGIDIQNIIGNPQQTAFQTEVQREASQKRVNVWFENRDLAYERLADLYKDLLKTHYPKKDAEGNYPVIEIEGEEVMQKDGNVKFRKKKNARGVFEVTPESLRGDIYVDVYTNTTAPTINAVDKEQKIQFMNSVSQWAVGYANAKAAGIDLEKILPSQKVVRDIAEDFNISIDTGGSKEDVTEAKAKLVDEIQRMAGSATVLPTNTEEQGLPNQLTS